MILGLIVGIFVGAILGIGLLSLFVCGKLNDVAQVNYLDGRLDEAHDHKFSDAGPGEVIPIDFPAIYPKRVDK